CGILSVASIPRRAATIRELPRNSENGMSVKLLKLNYGNDGAKISLLLLCGMPCSRMSHAREHTRIDGLDHVMVNLLGSPMCPRTGVETVYGDPVRCLRELIV